MSSWSVSKLIPPEKPFRAAEPTEDRVALPEHPRLLVVEDERHIAVGLRYNLEAEGYRVTLTESGEEALEHCRAVDEPYDLIVLDLMLPGISGFEVAESLRAAQDYTPVLILTARGRPDDVVHGFAAGADD